VIARRLGATLALLLVCARAGAQSPRADPSRQWEITDNSFLVEEAFNQERGVVQNIFTFTRGRAAQWDASFTQEWPAPGMTHQLSYTLAFERDGVLTGAVNTFLNYRYQVRDGEGGRTAIAPRVSVIVPSWKEDAGFATRNAGVQVNLPVSKQFGDFYVHANAGYTWVSDELRATNLGASGIWRVTPMFNLMLETVVGVDEYVTVSPGFRRGWNFGEKQLVIGLAAPITRAEGRSAAALLTYLSYELPFR